MRVAGGPGLGFHVVLQGSAWLIPPDGENPTELRNGDVVVVRNGSGYGLADDPDSPLPDVAVLELPDDDAVAVGRCEGEPSTVVLCGSFALHHARPHPLIAGLPEAMHLPARAGVDQRLRSVVDLLGAELDGEQPGTSAAIPALLDLLLLYSVRTWYDRQADRGARGWAAALRDPAVSRALFQLQRSPARPWTVAGLAGVAGLSRPAFARRFTDLVGQPPLTYLTWWRMTLAGRMLRADDSTLATVAARVGYTSEFAFSKAFRRAFGVSPGSYRRTAS
ncbi:AraC family transcriptional regulator [Cryptosporangium japonicum]|uniref:AraC family transcriptional regulator n=1 Tax=Cryptosporangium japonicum TaxID=80872 RepID=A0ABP3D510_9ACTN